MHAVYLPSCIDSLLYMFPVCVAMFEGHVEFNRRCRQGPGDPDIAVETRVLSCYCRQIHNARRPSLVRENAQSGK